MNANTVPISAWAVIELARDPELQRALREEVETTLMMDNEGRCVVDRQKMLALPLLQSVFVEVMRLHVSINITREVVQPLEIEGYRLPPGTVLQAPTEISHYAEVVWGVEGHPASEFWAARHVRYVDEKGEDGQVKRVPKFEMTGRATDWFPFGAFYSSYDTTEQVGDANWRIGGGLPICPGRHFAKQEIMLTVAMLVSRFEIQYVHYVHKDGSVSDEPPVNDTKYLGAAGVPPDRDMMVRWKRLW